MAMLVFAFICGLIAANWIKLNFDDRLVQFLLNGLDKAKDFVQKGFEFGWSRYQAHQEKDLLSLNGAVMPHSEASTSNSVQK